MNPRSLAATLPEIYARLLPPFFEREAPREEKATCSDCAMCAPKGAGPVAQATYFRPDTKCCTFTPILPCYLVGAILADERPDMQEGRARIRERIRARIGVRPQWLTPSRKAELLLRASRKHAFGRSLTLLCPYFEREKGLCTIWRHRESSCSTFFCKHEAGADGQTFWSTLRWFSVWHENALSAAAVEALWPGYKATEPLAGEMTLEDLEDRPPSEAAYEAMWGEWAGREEELYLRCHAWVSALTPEDLEQIKAKKPGYEDRFALLEEAASRLDHPALPDLLKMNPDLTASPTETGMLVVGHSKYEPLVLTADLFELVRAFGGGARVSDVKERYRTEHQTEIPDDLLITLQRFRVLVSPDHRELKLESGPPGRRSPP